jgi:hypothetical protein
MNEIEMKPARDALIDFLVKYGGRCRDCADEAGFCPRSGIGCGQREKAADYFVSALEYGSEHGFAGGYKLIDPATFAALVAERDEAMEEIDRLKAALSNIADSDDIENALDPQRNKRIAKTTLGN